MAASDTETQCRLPVHEAKSPGDKALPHGTARTHMYISYNWLRARWGQSRHIGTSLAANEVVSSLDDEARAWSTAWHDSFIAKCLR